MFCPNCNHNIPDGSEFCSYCGSKQETDLYCSFCGKELPPDSQFCQHCGCTVISTVKSDYSTTDHPLQKKKTKKHTAIILSVAGIIIAIAVMLIVIFFTKPSEQEMPVETKRTAKTFDEMTIDEKISESQYIGIEEFKKDPAIYQGMNRHISGYVIEGSPNNRVIGMTVAESLDKPYDFEDVLDYFPFTTSIDESRAHAAEFDSWPKTATVYVELLSDGMCKEVPIEGDYVDVFFVGDGRLKVSAYCVTVH